MKLLSVKDCTGLSKKDLVDFYKLDGPVDYALPQSLFGALLDFEPGFNVGGQFVFSYANKSIFGFLQPLTVEAEDLLKRFNER